MRRQLLHARLFYASRGAGGVAISELLEEKSNRGNTSKSELAPLRDTRVFTQRRWVGSRMIGPASPALLTLAPPALVLTNFATSPRDCDWRAVLQ